MDTKLAEMFKKSSFFISPEKYTYCTVKAIPTDIENHFMVSNDGDEITVVTSKPDTLKDITEQNKHTWLQVQLILHTPFMKGTLFQVSKAVFEADTNILVVSTYSKDILFVRQDHKEKVMNALEKLGFSPGND